MHFMDIKIIWCNAFFFLHVDFLCPMEGNTFFFHLHAMYFSLRIKLNSLQWIFFDSIFFSGTVLLRKTYYVYHYKNLVFFFVGLNPIWMRVDVVIVVAAATAANFFLFGSWNSDVAGSQSFFGFNVICLPPITLVCYSLQDFIYLTPHRRRHQNEFFFHITIFMFDYFS